MKFNVPIVRSVVENLDPPRFSDPTPEEFAYVVEQLESLEAMLLRLPVPERREALSRAVERGDDLWLPTAHNCLKSVGLALDPDGNCTFAVGCNDEPLVGYYSARTAAAYALFGRLEEPRIKQPCSCDHDGVLDKSDAALIEHIKESGWAVAAARRVDDLPSETLARISRLSERGVAHLFFEGGGLVLAMSGSTDGDRGRAVGRLAILLDRQVVSGRYRGVLISASETGSHYSEQRDWGLSVESRGGREAETAAAAQMFRASRQGSLAVVESNTERRRIETNRRRMRVEFIARRRSGEELVVRTAREIDDARERSRKRHWTEEPELRLKIEARRRSGRVKYDTARAIYLQRLPTLAHKLLYLLRRAGEPVPESEFLERHTKLCASDAADPKTELTAALRELAGAGKVRRLRRHESGRIYLAATEKLNRQGFGRDLARIVRDLYDPDRTPAKPEESQTTEVEKPVEETGHAVMLDSLEDESAAREIEEISG